MARPVQIDAFDRDILAFELFGADRDTGVEIFANKMVVTRAPHPCVICLEPVAAGSRVRAQTERSPAHRCVRTFYVCAECCEACRLATTDPDDAGRAIEARTALGIERARVA